MSSRAPGRGPTTTDTSAKVITPGMAERELARRKLPRAKRTAAARELAIAERTFWLSRETLKAIAEGAES